MGIKTYQEKNTNPMEQDLAQSDLPVRRKFQKTTQKCHFYEKLHCLGKTKKQVFFGQKRQFLGIFLAKKCP